MRMTRVLTVLILGLTMMAMGAAPFQVVKDGKATAKIVVSKGAHPCVVHAGAELQKWVKALTGAELPLVASADDGACIELCVAPEGYPEDMKALDGNDGYAVRTAGKRVRLFASCPKGVLNGVYRLLYKNTDIIWARPNKAFGTCFTKVGDLSLAQADYLDVPSFIVRGWHSGSGERAFDDWQMANMSNWISDSMHYKPEFAKYGIVSEYGGGHNLCGLYMKEENYYDAHPEYYPLIEGKRVRQSEKRGGVQLCFSNPAMTAAFTRELDSHIAAHPEQDVFRVLIEDSYHLCQCEECLKPIELQDGTLLPSTDPVFRSTQFYLWLNGLARHVKATSGKSLYTYAYFFTEPPPKCTLEDNIHVCFCPIYRNSKYTLHAHQNKRVKDSLFAWTKVTKNITWRDYYGLCPAFPRPIDVIAASDLVHLNTLGVNRTYTEMRKDTGINEAVWDLNSMYFWALAQLCWNPHVDVKALRMEFLSRVYGKAAESVREFYSIIEDSWYKIPGDSRWNDRGRGNWLSHVIRPQLVDACRAALAKAEKEVDRENGRIMLKRMRKVFEDNVDSQSGYLQSIQVPFIAQAPMLKAPFDAAPWKDAPSHDEFRTDNGTKVSSPTKFWLFYDDENIYFGIHCVSPKLAQALKARKKVEQRDVWQQGVEKVELFFEGVEVNRENAPASCQIAFTPLGEIYDSMNKDTDWNASFKLDISMVKDGWDARMVIPFTALGYGKRPDKMTMTCMRYLTVANMKTTTLFWNEAVPHNLVSFTRMEFTK